MQAPVVSVVMPCYNAESTVDEALASLAGQTLRDIEIVLVDDGSEDGTPDLLRRWAASDPRIRLVRREHGGIVEALNHGIAHTRARYLARMDADDRSHPRRLARQLSFMEAHPDIAAAGCLVSAFPAGAAGGGLRAYLTWMNSLVTHEQIARELFVESPLVHPSVMMRRDWIERIGGYQEHGWPEDYDLWLRLAAAGARFAKVPEALFEWREHPGRLTRRDSRYSLDNFLRLKAHHLARGPMRDRDGVIIWGAGVTGRRISGHLLREGVAPAAFLDVSPRKIGSTRRGRPVLAVEELPGLWARFERPALLAAVGSRGARELIRARLVRLGLLEGADWWCVA